MPLLGPHGVPGAMSTAMLIGDGPPGLLLLAAGVLALLQAVLRTPLLGAGPSLFDRIHVVR